MVSTQHNLIDQPYDAVYSTTTTCHHGRVAVVVPLYRKVAVPVKPAGKFIPNQKLSES